MASPSNDATTPLEELIASTPGSTWLPILESSNQLVLYDTASHALSVTPSTSLLTPARTRLPLTIENGNQQQGLLCPYCSRPFPNNTNPNNDLNTPEGDSQPHDHPTAIHSESTRRAPNYFQLLELANFESNSRPSSPPPLTAPSRFERSSSRLRADGFTKSTDNSRTASPMPRQRFGDGSMAQGYFAAFFKEEKRLGMGANGSVYLCQHVLDGNYLGHFAVKKIAVGHSHEYLLKILREVRLLESLRHPNIVSYHHSWLETTRFSSFGLPVPTLHVLMEWAECGSLDDLIDARQGKRAQSVDPFEPIDDENESGMQTRSSRIRAFKAAKQSPTGSQTGVASRRLQNTAAVHLLSSDEIRSYLGDIVAGLGFLHDRSILHLDLKMGNVLLTNDEGRLIPRAMLSDFGTSQDALQTARVRSGNTGTVEYSAPEALARDQEGRLLQIDSKADMWSLGMILHKLVFFKLPYPEIDSTEVDSLEKEVLAYPGWKSTPDIVASCKRRGLPRALLVLLESLLHKNPQSRPTADRVLSGIKAGTLETGPTTRSGRSDATSVAIVRRASPVDRRNSKTPTSTSSLEAMTLHDFGDQPAPSIDDKDTTPTQSPFLALPSPEQNAIALSLKDLIIQSLSLPYTPSVNGRWKALRASFLMLKIVSLGNVCRPTHPVMWVQSIAVIFAVMDMWQEGGGEQSIKLSLLLGVIHMGLIMVVRAWNHSLCTF